MLFLRKRMEESAQWICVPWVSACSPLSALVPAWNHPALPVL